VQVIKSLQTTGTFLLCGYISPFPTLSLKDRESSLKALESSYLRDLQILYRAFYSVSSIHAFGVGSIENPNSTWKALKYCIEDLIPLQSSALLNIWRPKFVDTSNVSSLEYDIVIVGSGCGGGLMACELSKEGYKVLLCEKAPYLHNSEYKYGERDGFSEVLERKGAFQSENGSITVMAGNAWGGGSAVNWSASFKPPQALLEEWKKVYGLGHLVEPEFQKGVDYIWSIVGASQDGVIHNTPNQILLDGCKEIGLDGHTIDQNTGGQIHDCGFCTLGCPSGIKRSSAVTWIKEASKYGCDFLSDIYIQKVKTKNGVATGVVGLKDDKLINVTAKKAVVVSAGSLNTPALLLRSQIKNLNPHVGKHLRLHPVAMVSAVFPEKNIHPYKGSIMTAVATVNDKEGYGYKLEVPTAHPSMNSIAQNWKNGAAHKLRMLLWPHTSSVIVLTRDKDSEGTIWTDNSGQPRLEWSLGKLDEKSMIDGTVEAVKILVAAGATEVYTNQLDVPSYYPNKSLSIKERLESKELAEFIKQIRTFGTNPKFIIGMLPRRSLIFCAHQMGSCRMSNNPKQGAVNPRGQLFGVRKLYLSDASVFPTASGVK
jgi:choline dehydrogenase-like flavoprotein